jgi:tripartite-type tricarboxylate transporter receptor subunit TctC
MEEALGAKVKRVTGYQPAEMPLAFERNEVDSMGTGYTNLMGQYPHFLEKKLARVMVQFGRATRLPELADVPTGRELAQNADDLSLLEISEAPITIGFPLAAPPEVPAERLAILRAAFKATMEDPDYRADSVTMKTEYSPKYDAQLLADLTRMVQTPPAVLERYRKLAAAEAAGGR